MKKSKVIIPAMAMILFSTAASISGTVAWFTANRVFNTTVGNFSVAETEGNLKCTLAKDIGTTYDSTTNSVSVRKTGNPAILTHGSVNALTTGANYGKAFVINPDTEAFDDRTTGEGTGTNGWLYRSGMKLNNNSEPPAEKTVDVYIAVSWKMTFTYEFGGESKPMAIFLNLKDSVITDATPDTGYDFTDDADTEHTGLDTKKGFRIGFYNAVNEGTTTAATNRHDVVWGNNAPVTTGAPSTFAPNTAYDANAKVQKDGVVYSAKDDITDDHVWNAAEWAPTGEVTAVTALKYVTATDTETAFTATNYVYTQSGYEKRASDAVAANADIAEKICVLTPTNNSVTVTCAAWFEGTDPNVVSGSAMSCLSASMSFYARSVTTA